MILNLVLIPKIDSFAQSFNSQSSFSYTYQGNSYSFIPGSGTGSLFDYYIQDTVLNTVIEKDAEAFNLSLSEVNNSIVSWGVGNLILGIANLYHNFMIAMNKPLAAFGEWDIYGFEYQFTGIDENYFQHELFGPAYGFRFVGWAGEVIDLVLDQDGNLYGSRIIGNYTFSDDQREFSIWSTRQFDDGDIWIPPFVSSLENLPTPYFEGTTLNLRWFDSSNNEHHYQITNFEKCLLGITLSYNSSGISYYFIGCYYDAVLNNQHEFFLDGQSKTQEFSVNSVSVNVPNVGIRNYNGSATYIDIANGNLPSNSINVLNPSSTWGPNSNVLLTNNRGILNKSLISGQVSSLWLDKRSISPITDPFEIPYDDPVNLIDITDDPVEFEPIEDPEPVPGIDYPSDDPLPWPVPSIPPIVSGNDDLWPDLNITFELEDDLIGFANPLRDFEWPSFDYLIADFTSAIVWVSVIMTSLFEGSDYHILFSVLSVFFIAASLLGLYKWWHK